MEIIFFKNRINLIIFKKSIYSGIKLFSVSILGIIVFMKNIPFLSVVCHDSIIPDGGMFFIFYTISADITG